MWPVLGGKRERQDGISWRKIQLVSVTRYLFQDLKSPYAFEIQLGRRPECLDMPSPRKKIVRQDSMCVPCTPPAPVLLE